MTPSGRAAPYSDCAREQGNLPATQQLLDDDPLARLAEFTRNHYFVKGCLCVDDRLSFGIANEHTFPQGKPVSLNNASAV